MPSILPTVRLAPTRFNPKIIVAYGMPKVGKTTIVGQLDSCLIEDMESGAVSFTSMRVPVPYIDGKTVFKYDDDGNQMYNPDGSPTLAAISFNEVITQIMEYAKDFQKTYPGKKVPYLYKRICLDTLDKFEDMCEVSATVKYKNSIIGKSFDGKSILELPKGAGYFHLRNEVLDKIDQLSFMCETLVLLAHTKDKITDKGGVEVTSKDISLTGRLGAMVCAKADLITYLFREPNKPLMASLETFEGGIMGAREFPHLKDLYGKRFEFSWDKILIDPAKV